MMTSLVLAFLLFSLAVQGSQIRNLTADLYASDTLRPANLLLPVSRITTSDVTAATFSDSETGAVHPSLFGPLRQMVASQQELEPYVHPRIVTGPSQWDDLLSMYADPQTFNTDGTWSKSFRGLTVNTGPNSQFLIDLAELETTGGTSAYDGRTYEENSSEYQAYRDGLEELANRIVTSSSGNSDSFPICALWASVAMKQQSLDITPFIDVNTVQTCIKAAVAWSKIVLAHRTYHCNPNCPTSGANYAYLWNTQQGFSLHHNWFLGGTGIGFTYDLLYAHISVDDRVLMRSALALFVMNRWSWGSSETSTRASPNALVDPHRMFSNWAGYNSNLYLANLAIEGETGFDKYTTAVLTENNASGFNQGLHSRYSAVLEQFMLHSFYPDGSTFEDGYSYFTALREGSLGLVASHRRGSNVLGSPRFRNIIHNAAQMHEPWHCGSLIGHASGGGILYNAYVGLFRYAFPQGELPGMLWRQRFGVYKNNSPCRVWWFQSMLQLAFLGGEHSSAADSPENLDSSLQVHFKKSFYATRRGLLIARSSLSEKATYMHFDARPDAFFLGHDNADRGVFTFTALRQTWLDDLHWSGNLDSRKHSLMHIDGLAQDMKAPSGKMMKVEDNGEVVLAAADLTYTYNVQWAKDQLYNTAPTRAVTVYNADGLPTTIPTLFSEKEESDPWALGWPVDDRAQDIGFTDDMTLNGVETVGFQGIWMWKRAYRDFPLSQMVRSSVLVRSVNNEVGYGIVVDSVSAGAGSHEFESYLILHQLVFVDEVSSQCNGNTCTLILSTGGAGQVDIHVTTLGNDLSYRTETFDTDKKRLIVKSVREDSEEFWLVFHPHEGTPDNLSVARNMDGHSVILYEGEERRFAVNGMDRTVEQVANEAEVSASPSTTPSSLPSESATPSVSVSPSSTPTTTPSLSASASPIISASTSPVVSSSASPSPAVSESTTPSISPSGSPSVSASVYPSSSASSSPSSSSTPSTSLSATPSRSASTSPSPSLSVTPSPAGTPPMEPLILTGRTVFSESQMTSNKNLFYHDTNAPYQAVFKVTSKSDESLGVEDLFRTCYSATKVSTSLLLLDCGNGAAAPGNYALRECSAVEDNISVRRCRNYRTKFQAALTPGKIYYLVASIYPVKYALALTIRHSAISV